jgi:uncharacterized membrane protein YphA (DoxX/SURF4 family)
MNAWAIGLSTVTALAFTAAAAANAFDLGGTAKNFRDWGYPRVWRFVTALLEVAGAAMIVVPQTRQAGVALLGLVIVAAIATIVRVRAGWSHLVPALGFGLLLIAESLSVGWFV